MAVKKDPNGVTLRKYGTAIRKRWPLKEGWIIGATPRREDEFHLPIHQWSLRWTVTKGARKKDDPGGSSKGRTLSAKGTYSGPDEKTATFATAHEAYLLYVSASGDKLEPHEMPPRSNPPMSLVDAQGSVSPEKFDQLMNELVIEEVGTPSIDVLGGDRPFESRGSSEFSSLKDRARELLHAYTMMETDLRALEEEMGAFSTVFSSTKALRETEEARLLALAVAGKLTPRALREKLDTPKRDTCSFKHEGVSIVLVGASFRCTACSLIKPGSAFGMRRMTTGEFRNQAQCSECRSVHDHSRLQVVTTG